MDAVVLYRRGVVSRSEDAEELAAIAAAGLPVVHQRAALVAHPGALVVPRYALWPFVTETLRDVEMLGGRPVNDAHASAFVRDLGAWAPALDGLTPATAPWAQYVARPWPGPVVLKGAERSRRDRWGTHMFAAGPAEAAQVMGRLADDPVAGQGVYVRAYVPLAPCAGDDGAALVGLSGAPVVQEFRVFVLDGVPVARGFYWAPFADQCARVPDPGDVPATLLADASARLADECPSLRFIAMDVARRADGGWIVVEINDGCQSGLSGCDPAPLYAALARAR